mgnify:CR=1 FL=1
MAEDPCRPFTQLISHDLTFRSFNLTPNQPGGFFNLALAPIRRQQQILRNLLSNAFKFTEKGTVSLNIREEARYEGAHLQQWIVFDVADTGIGIAKDKHLTIFEAFQQADGTISRQYGGTGLGLSISRDLARLLKGFIILKSMEGKGSTFSVSLPAKE